MDVHIDTIAIYFLNNSGCFFVICSLHLLLRLLWELHSRDMRIRNDSYLRCLDYNYIFRKGYQQSYGEIYDLLMDLNLFSIGKGIRVRKDHVYRKCFWFGVGKKH